MLTPSFMSLARAVAANCVLLVALSCGGVPAAPQAPAGPVSSAAAPATMSPDLSAVADPPALVASGRIGKPSASLSIVHEWTNLPMPQSDEVTELVMGEAIGPLVDLEQPIDFAVAVVGSGAGMRDRTAVSVALKDVDRATATLADRYKLAPGDNGALLLQGLGRAAHHGDTDDGDDEGRSCELAPAYGAAPVRLVCGWSAKALGELAPWLTRTMTRAAAVDDLHVDVRLRGLRGTLVREGRMLAMVLANELAADHAFGRDVGASLARGLVDFAIDVDTAALSVTMSEAVASVALTFTLSGKASSMAQLMTVFPAQGLATPPVFWELPGGADAAFFEPGIDDVLLAQWRGLLLRAVGEELGRAGVREGDRKPIVDALGRLVPSGAMSYASGIDSDAARKALAAEQAVADSAPAAERAEAKRASIEALFGWHVAEIDQPAGQLTGALKDFTASWGRPGVADAYRSMVKGGAPPILHTAPLPHGAALPAGTQHYVLELRSLDLGSVSGGLATKGAKPTRPFSIHLLVAPEGERTWIAIAGNDLSASSALAAAMGHGGDKLGARPELAGLKAPVVLGGFVTLRGLLEASQQGTLIAEGSTQGAAEALGELASLPHHGVVPMPLYWGADPRKVAPLVPGVAVPVGVGVTVTRAAIEDIATAIIRHGGF
jgi:hypothetical protein